jgi:hypothetical protein
MASNWSQPVGYAFSAAACKADEMKALLFHCLTECEKHGVKVKVIISDQGPNMQQFVRKLGVTIEQPYFIHNAIKYFYMFDTPHLLKSVRNNLHKYSIHFGKKAATWNIIKQFYEIDKQQQIKCCPKLTDSHIYLPAFSRMKVRFATQVFSKSLARGLQLHNQFGKLDNSASETAEFLSKFDDIFDCMNNCRLSHVKPMLCALSDRTSHLTFIEESIDWIAKLKVMNGNVDVSKKVKCFMGWQLSLTVIKHLWPVLRDEHNFEFLFTRRLNQDCLENLFSVVRHKGGNCTNPTPIHFSRIFKQITCDKLLKPVATGNCEIDVTEVLQTMCNSTCVFESSIDREDKRKFVDTPLLAKQVAFRTNLLPSDQMSVLEDNALHYVAGYLLRIVLMWHNCDVCGELFRGNNGYPKRNEVFTNLKKYNVNSGLVNVSQTFHYYIQTLETMLQSVVKNSMHEYDIGKKFLSDLKVLDVPTKCKGFPKIKFLMFFTRLHLYYILKYQNSLGKNTTQQRKVYKQFAHV